MLAQFEKLFSHFPTAKEPKHLWVNGYIYTNDEANKAFIAFRYGYAFARGVYLNA
jgi:hypothetical protein